MKRLLILLLICLLTLYAPLELTRVIIHWGLLGPFKDTIPASNFIFEISFMWLLYAIAIFIISMVVTRKHM